MKKILQIIQLLLSPRPRTQIKSATSISLQKQRSNKRMKMQLIRVKIWNGQKVMNLSRACWKFVLILTRLRPSAAAIGMRWPLKCWKLNLFQLVSRTCARRSSSRSSLCRTFLTLLVWTVRRPSLTWFSLLGTSLAVWSVTLISSKMYSMVTRMLRNELNYVQRPLLKQ